MKEEDIDKRIERVVKSVGSKKAAMRQWETDRVSEVLRRKVATKKWCTYGISAAASIVVICGIGLGFFINRGSNNDYGVSSSAPVFRGSANGIDEIQNLINSGEYENALASINNLMCDTIIDSTLTPERQEYKRSLYRNQEYELTWLKIISLHQLGRNDEAIGILEKYSELEGSHQDESKYMLEQLTK